MFIVNHSALPDALATQIVNVCISAYENLYGKPSCEVEIILCSSKRKMKQEQISIMGKDNYEDTPNHDGDFIIPDRYSKKMTITVIAKKEIIAGAKIFLNEMSNGSLRDADLSDEQWEKRGLRRGEDTGLHLAPVPQKRHQVHDVCPLLALVAAARAWPANGFGKTTDWFCSIRCCHTPSQTPRTAVR